MMGIRSEFCAVEGYGFQLPVLINEALTFNEKHVNVSVHCAENGWSWVVHGRRLLVWQYKDIRVTNTPNSSMKSLMANTSRGGQQGRRNASTISQCRELTLPHCDIGHKATLVSVFQTDEHQMASCVAVSPTGEVRYWPSIAHDGSSVDLTNILDGQEFDYLLPLPAYQQMPLSYLLVTTTCNLILLQLQLQNGRYVLQHRNIRQPSGFLGGIGKRFASIIIGMNSATDKENVKKRFFTYYINMYFIFYFNSLFQYIFRNLWPLFVKNPLLWIRNLMLLFMFWLIAGFNVGVWL